MIKINCVASVPWEYYSVTKKKSAVEIRHNLGGPHDNYAGGNKCTNKRLCTGLIYIILSK